VFVKDVLESAFSPLFFFPPISAARFVAPTVPPKVFLFVFVSAKTVPASGSKISSPSSFETTYFLYSAVDVFATIKLAS